LGKRKRVEDDDANVQGDLHCHFGALGAYRAIFQGFRAQASLNNPPIIGLLCIFMLLI
jgi:hypothetical protein